MKLTNLQHASDYEVEDWLKKQLDLTPYQKEKLRDSELIRFAPFEFYKHRKQVKTSILWRLTIIFVPIYLLLLIISLPIKFVITNQWGYGDKFYDNFHAVWWNKLNL